MDVFSNVGKLNGIGKKREELFNAKGIYSLLDLLFYLPKSFKDFSIVQKLDFVGEKESLFLVEIKNKPQVSYGKKGMRLAKFRVFDETCFADVYFFNMPYIASQFNKGDKVYLFGKKIIKDDKIFFTNPIFQRNIDSQHKFIPVYANIHGISQNMIIKTIQNALDSIKDSKDYLTKEFIDEFKMPDFFSAHKNNHFPEFVDDEFMGTRRFSIEEMLVLLCFLDMQSNVKLKTDIKISIDEDDEKTFFDCIDFCLTNAQIRTIDDIKKDLSSGQIMNRLVQGDVGSGKTIVAFFAMYMNFVNRFQSIMMAPTEVLAKQHYKNAMELFSKLDMKIAMLTGSMSEKDKREVVDGLESGEISMIIGTHALLYSEINYKSLNLVITDEQHRFGVAQKAKISYNGKLNTLVMSATPIPRTLALILYSNIDVSIIDELPKGRKKIKTHIVGENKRKAMYEYIKSEIDKGFQAYVVCPLIECEDDADDKKSVYKVYDEIKNVYGFEKCAVLHGKMKDVEKQGIMKDFIDKKIDIVVATTVIEVGIDVANASIIVIEDAYKFGISTLHQLRGRVGRGHAQSYCFLVSEKKNERLDILVKENDGFKLAEKDLEIRGPGQFLGQKQHGVDDFHMQSIIRDSATLNESKVIYQRMKNGEFSHEYHIVKKKAQKKYEDVFKNIVFN